MSARCRRSAPSPLQPVDPRLPTCGPGDASPQASSARARWCRASAGTYGLTVSVRGVRTIDWRVPLVAPLIGARRHRRRRARHPHLCRSRALHAAEDGGFEPPRVLPQHAFQVAWTGRGRMWADAFGQVSRVRERGRVGAGGSAWTQAATRTATACRGSVFVARASARVLGREVLVHPGAAAAPLPVVAALCAEAAPLRCVA